MPADRRAYSADAMRLRFARASAFAAALRRLRHEYPTEYRRLLAVAITRSTATVWASTQLRRRHPARASVLYAEELAARGLPAPRPQPGRWPTDTG